MDANGPQRVQEGLETHHYYDLRQNKQAVTSSSYGQDFRHEYPAQRSQKIAGLSTRIFWLVIALIAVVVVAASVGGAVGGTAHLNKSSSVVPSSAASSSSGGSSSSSSSSTSASASTTSSIPSSTSSAPQSTFSATTDCPGSNDTLFTPVSLSGGAGKYTFRKLCGFDHSSSVQGNIAAFVPTFEACISMCANMNGYRDQGDTTSSCQTVSYLATGKLPANCWASNSSLIVPSNIGVSIGLLTISATS